MSEDQETGLGASPDSRASSAGGEVRAIVVGAGKMGLLHGGLLKAYGASVVALVDRSWASRFVARGLGLDVPACSSLEEAIRQQPRANACFVCTPPSSHYVVARRALESGLHTFVEKPLTMFPEHSRALAKLAGERGRSGTVGYVRRHSPVFREFKRRVAAKGTPRSVRVQILSPQFVGTTEHQAAKRGGLEWDLLPHAVDVLLWSLADRGRPEVAKVTRDGFSAVTVTGYLGGTEFEVLADWSRGDVRKVELTATVSLEDGSGLIAREEQVWEEDASGQKRAGFHERDAAPPAFDIAGAQFSFQTEDVLCAMRGGPSFAATFEDGARVDAFVEECAGR